MSDLQDSLGRREVIILDGGMGTELDKRGVPMHGLAWSAAAIETHPEVVRQLHQEYIAAGARVIIANTFATSRLVLEPAGMGDRVTEINTRAVELAREARDTTPADGPVLVAVSISTANATRGSALLRGSGELALEQRSRAAYREQAELLAQAGVDPDCSGDDAGRFAGQLRTGGGPGYWAVGVVGL